MLQDRRDERIHYSGRTDWLNPVALPGGILSQFPSTRWLGKFLNTLPYLSTDEREKTSWMLDQMEAIVQRPACAEIGYFGKGHPRSTRFCFDIPYVAVPPSVELPQEHVTIPAFPANADLHYLNFLPEHYFEQLKISTLGSRIVYSLTNDSTDRLHCTTCLHKAPISATHELFGNSHDWHGDTPYVAYNLKIAFNSISAHLLASVSPDLLHNYVTTVGQKSGLSDLAQSFYLQTWYAGDRCRAYILAQRGDISARGNDMYSAWDDAFEYWTTFTKDQARKMREFTARTGA